MTCNFIDYDVCANPSNLADAFVSRISHNYQNGQTLRSFVLSILAQVVSVESVACSMLDSFVLDTAEGEQLEMLGLLVGMPRTLCGVSRATPQLCPSLAPTVPLEDYTFTDESEYRKFIKAMIYSLNFDGTATQYESILQFVFDDIPFGDPLTGAAKLLNQSGGIISIGINRELTDVENQRMELVKYTLPYYGSTDVRVTYGVDFFRLGTNAATGLCAPMGAVL